MKRFKQFKQMPILRSMGFRRQKGVALVAAIFLITALSVIGALMTQLMVLGSEETINEWYSAQALYAAESGAEWSIYNSGATDMTGQAVVVGRAWFNVTTTMTNFAGGNVLYTITSTGLAGEASTNIRTQRELLVQYMP